MESLLRGPFLLLLGQRAIVPLAAPLLPRGSDPAIKNAAAVEIDAAAELVDQLAQLRLALE